MVSDPNALILQKSTYTDLNLKDAWLYYRNRAFSDYFGHLLRVFLYSTSHFMQESPSRRPLATFRLRRNVAAKFAARFYFFSDKRVFSRNLFIFKANFCQVDQQEI